MPLSPVVITVPVVAGSVSIVPVPAIAAGITCTVPLVLPGSVTLVMPASARFALDLLSATLVVPIYVVSARSATVESTAIVTAALPLKLVPERPVPIVKALVVVPPPPPPVCATHEVTPLPSVLNTYPLVPALVGNVRVHVPAATAGCTVTAPEVDPLSTIFPLVPPADPKVNNPVGDELPIPTFPPFGFSNRA